MMRHLHTASHVIASHTSLFVLAFVIGGALAFAVGYAGSSIFFDIVRTSVAR